MNRLHFFLECNVFYASPETLTIFTSSFIEFKLIPAYLLVMTIEHSAATFTEIQTRKLLLKICNGLQGIAWVCLCIEQKFIFLEENFCN